MHKDNKKHYIQTLLAFFLHHFSKKISFLPKKRRKHPVKAVRTAPKQTEKQPTQTQYSYNIYRNSKKHPTTRRKAVATHIKFTIATKSSPKSKNHTRQTLRSPSGMAAP